MYVCKVCKVCNVCNVSYVCNRGIRSACSVLSAKNWRGADRMRVQYSNKVIKFARRELSEHLLSNGKLLKGYRVNPKAFIYKHGSRRGQAYFFGLSL